MSPDAMTSMIIEEMVKANVRLDASVAEPISSALSRISALHDGRITELLQHNNELLDRARKAERLVEDLKVSLKGCATVVGMMARMEESK